MTESKEKKEQKEICEVKISTIIYSGLTIGIIFLGILVVAIYFFGAQNDFTKRVERAIPFPAAIAGKKIITFSELNETVGSVRRFYENQDFSSVGMRVDFSTEDGKKRLKIKERDVLSKLIENAVIESECKKRNIVLTTDMVSQEVNRSIKEYGNESDVEDNLFRLYGWTVRDFEKNIVRPDMLQEKLMEKLKASDSSYVEAKGKIEKALAEVKAGKDFSEVVKKYSEGESAKRGGNLGWFVSEEMLPEISRVVFLMDKGKTSEIIESPLGYHVVKLEGKKNEDGEDKVDVRQIFVKTRTMSDWLSEFEKENKIFVLVNGIYWNREDQQVEFRDRDMREFESKIFEDSAEDVSNIF